VGRYSVHIVNRYPLTATANISHLFHVNIQ